MNKLLVKVMKEHTPKISKKATEGTAKEILKYMPVFLNNIFMDSIKSLNSDIDLVYLGYRIVSPEEEFNNFIIKKNGSVNIDISKNDLYLIELKFTYMGEPLNKYLYLPFASKGNLIKLSDVHYYITPVLSDSVISPSKDQVFIRLLMAKLTFKSIGKNFILNGNKIAGDVIYSSIMNVNKNNITDNIGKPLMAISVYLAAKYGFKGTLKRYSNIDDVVVTYDEDIDMEKYDVFESYKQKPRGLLKKVYLPNKIKIGVKKGYDNPVFIKNYIYGIIYTLDIFSEQVEEIVEYINNSDYIKMETDFWKLIIGRVSYKNSYNVTRMYTDVVDHFETLDGYIDSFTKSKFSNEYSSVNNFFDLLHVILYRYPILINTSKEFNSSLDNRYLDILYYLAYDIIIGFNKAMLTINKRYNKKALSYKEVSKIINNELSTRLIFKLTKSSSMNVAVNLAESIPAFMFPKLTSNITDQSTAVGVRKTSNASNFPESTRTLRADDLALGTLLYLSKSSPTPRFHANMFLDYDIYTGRINISDDMRKKLDKLDLLLTGRTENKHINDSIIADVEDTSDMMSDKEIFG